MIKCNACAGKDIEWGVSCRLIQGSGGDRWTNNPFPSKAHAEQFILFNSDIYQCVLIYREIGPWKESNG